MKRQNSTKSLRADAQQNRDHIISVARDALAKDPNTSLNAIAKLATIGPGTLYRHFPNREALIVGVYLKEIENLVALSTELLSMHKPLRAFQLWLEQLAHYGRVKHGFGNELHAAMTDEIFQDTYWPMVEALRHLLQACEKSGEIHPGADPEDILLLLGFLWRIKPSRGAKARADRLLKLIIAGLQAS
jgi:AcrR family transcriptional regulator